MDEAQHLGLTTSATNVIGFGENNEHRLKHMDKLRRLQDRNLADGFDWIYIIYCMACSIGKQYIWQTK